MKKLKLTKKKQKVNLASSKKDVIVRSETTKQSQKIMRLPRPAFGGTRNDGLSNLLNKFLLFLFIFLLPTQLGKHFFFKFSYLSGVRVDYLAPTIYVTDILAFLLFIMNFKLVWHFLKQKKILILLSLLFVNLLVSRFPPVTLYRYLKILEVIGIFYIFKKGLFPRFMLLSGFLLAAAFELILSTLQFINKHSLQGLFYFFGERPLNLSMPGIAKASLSGLEILRPYGTFSHPNSMAGFYLLVYFFILTAKKIPDSLSKKILLLVSSLLVFLSFSKVAIATFLLLNFIYLWRSSLKKNCRLCFISHILIISIVSLVFLQAKTDPLSLQKRLLLTQNSLVIIGQHPFFGVGLGNYLLAQQQFPQRYADFLNQPVHNLPLLLLSEIGVVMLIIICIIFLKEFKNAVKNFPYIFVVVLLTGLFDHYWLTLQQNFLLIGLVLGVL